MRFITLFIVLFIAAIGRPVYLERVIDTKNYEKTALTYDQNSNQDRINNLLKVNEVTLIQNEKLTAEKKQLSKDVLKMKFYFVLLFLIIAFLLYKILKKKQSV